MRDQQFSPGFRLSKTDILVLLIASIASMAVGSTDIWVGGVIAFVIAFVVCHFFLFCNVFRISRPLEFVWAGAFLVLGVCSAFYSIPGWTTTFLLALGVTISVVLIEMRKPSYHGIMWQRINPQLRDWWDANADWEAEYRDYVAAQIRAWDSPDIHTHSDYEPPASFLDRLSCPAEADLRWLIDAVKDENKRDFVHSLIWGATSLSEKLFLPLIQKEVNKLFAQISRLYRWIWAGLLAFLMVAFILDASLIVPLAVLLTVILFHAFCHFITSKLVVISSCRFCTVFSPDLMMKAYGPRRVIEYLLNELEFGGHQSKLWSVEVLGGAVVPLHVYGKEDWSEYSYEDASPRSLAAYEQLEDLWCRKRRLLLQVFLKTRNVSLRAMILYYGLNLKVSDHPPDWASRVEKAIAISANSKVLSRYSGYELPGRAIPFCILTNCSDPFCGNGLRPPFQDAIFLENRLSDLSRAMHDVFPFLTAGLWMLPSKETMRSETARLIGLADDPSVALDCRLARGSQCETPVRLPWLDVDEAIVIAAGDDLGRYSAIALDFRPYGKPLCVDTEDDPCVVASDWSAEDGFCVWREIAPSFYEFTRQCGLENIDGFFFSNCHSPPFQQSIFLENGWSDLSRAMHDAFPSLTAGLSMLPSMETMRDETNRLYCLEDDPTYRLARECLSETPVRLPWLDVDQAIVIALGDDLGRYSAIALDFRPHGKPQHVDPKRNPSVVANDWSAEDGFCKWREIAPSFEEFIRKCGLENLFKHFGYTTLM